ncbi:hypothetical protein GGU11DRAFT_787692 [Lentinula aff. detonsa]|nr:hypothetical protein GGU11DRAFT_787692 [Lentinula aff. detonsa]
MLKMPITEGMRLKCYHKLQVQCFLNSRIHEGMKLGWTGILDGPKIQMNTSTQVDNRIALRSADKARFRYLTTQDLLTFFEYHLLNRYARKFPCYLEERALNQGVLKGFLKRTKSCAMELLFLLLLYTLLLLTNAKSSIASLQLSWTRPRMRIHENLGFSLNISDALPGINEPLFIDVGLSVLIVLYDLAHPNWL